LPRSARLNGLTPYEYIAKIWTSEPDRFIVDPIHQMPGLNNWPDGPRGEPKSVTAPMWGRAVVAENEMMFHHAQATGPVSMRCPAGLHISSKIGVDPTVEGGWRIETFGEVTQQIPPEEIRLLVHWGARVFIDMDDLKRTFDHTDDITHDQALNILVSDLRKKNVAFEMPSDPMSDRAFIGMLSQVYAVNGPTNVPADIDERRAGRLKSAAPHERAAQCAGAGRADHCGERPAPQLEPQHRSVVLNLSGAMLLPRTSPLDVTQASPFRRGLFKLGAATALAPLILSEDVT